jgi:heme-degrading monooxygenase HmoA
MKENRLDIKPPYYAVIFTSQRTANDNGYAEMAKRMDEKARQYEGYLGIESARDQNGFGITVSYWRGENDFKAWKQDMAHLEAQEKGQSTWYENYRVRIAKVEREYAHPKS